MTETEKNDKCCEVMKRVPKDHCVFCRIKVREGDAHEPAVEVNSVPILVHKGCLYTARALEGGVNTPDELRDEVVDSQKRTCYICHERGATIICPNRQSCGATFHFTCRAEPQSGQFGLHCLRCPDNPNRPVAEM